MKKILALLLAVAMIATLFAGCNKEPDPTNAPTQAATDAPTEAPTAAPTEAARDNETLVVAYSYFSNKFSPFFATTAYDQDVAGMVSISLLGTDREGNVVQKGIEGEVRPYNGTDYTYYGIADLAITENADGTVDYDFVLKDDLKFSDGSDLTIDDVIFSLYVLSDPTYDGSSTFYAQPIEGMAEYRANMTTLSALLAKLGKDNKDFTYVTEAQQTAFWAAVEDGMTKFAQEIVDYCVSAGFGKDSNDVATAAGAWDFELEAGATATDFALAIGEKYGWNFSAMEAETAGTALADLIPAEVYAYSTEGVATGDSAPNITGIIKTGDNSLRIHMTKLDATAIYQVGQVVAPLSYYGNPDLYDYENNSFGFPKGDLTSVREKTTAPLGAGPYKFVSYANGVVTFEANEYYFQGTPKTKYVAFKEGADSEKLTAVGAGSADIADPSMSGDTVKAIQDYNTDTKALDGAVITTKLVDNLGYGYLGINSDTVRVGTESGSEASNNLRKGLMTVFSVYRDTAIESYYGELASIINYPISNTSWAAPRPADEGYKIAYSTDVEGNAIYTTDMTAEQKEAAALAACIGYLKAAGYTFDEATGKFTAAPEGAKLAYEVIIPADGKGDHPAFAIMTNAKNAFETIGITLNINDPADSNVLWDAIDAGTQELWIAAWGSTVDPDMYQVYHSSNIPGVEGGTGSNKYHIASETLDKLIMDGRATTDQAARKTIYKQALEEILNWGVELPTYQRSNGFIFSTERVNMETITPDMTPFWTWMAEVDKIELN